jgi:L-asparaginase
VLYKQSDVDKKIDNFRKSLNNAEMLNNYTIRDYDESLPEESFYESTRSRILLCLIDDEWFYDSQCRKIWRFFWTKQLEHKHQVLFPILIKKISVDNFDAEGLKSQIYKNASEILGFYDYLDSETIDISRLFNDVHISLANLIKDDPDGEQSSTDETETTNVHDVYMIPCYSEEKSDKYNNTCWDKRIEKNDIEIKNQVDFNNRSDALDETIKSLNNVLMQRYKAINDKRKFDDSNKVCVLYTGGSAGMIFEPLVRDSLELKQADLKQLIIKLPRLKKEKFEIDFYSFDPALDSSNIGSKHWLLMAAVMQILSKEYTGFVIIHGTNTMAYTASALSFLFDNTAGKPIILTGSELALTERNSDAEQNIHRAIEIAAQKDTNDITGVCILFGKWILRGDRATKQIALDKTEGFYSPNFPEIASVSSDKVVVDLAHITKKKNSENNFYMNKFMSSYPKVAICDIYPDMDMTAFETTCKSPAVKAIILRTYGTGGVPDRDPAFIRCLEDLKDDKIVVNLTQCPKGTSEFRLFETNETLFNYGVISGGDMVTEAAYCKLKHLFSKFSSAKDIASKMKCIRHYMMVSIQGEMSRSMFIISVPTSSPITTIDESGSEFKLLANWSSNPAASEGLEINVDNDDFARLDNERDIIESAVLRLGQVSVNNRPSNNTEFQLKIKVTILNYTDNEAESDNNTIVSSIKYSACADKSQDIGIDILDIAKSHLKPGYKTTIIVKSLDRSIDVKSLMILLSSARR